MSRDENIQAVFDLKVGYTLGLADIEILKRVACMALTAMDGEPVVFTDERNLHHIAMGRETSDLGKAELRDRGYTALSAREASAGCIDTSCSIL